MFRPALIETFLEARPEPADRRRGQAGGTVLTGTVVNGDRGRGQGRRRLWCFTVSAPGVGNGSRGSLLGQTCIGVIVRLAGRR